MCGAPYFAPLSLGALTRSSFIQDTVGSCLCRLPPIIFCSLSSPKLSPGMEDQGTLPTHPLFPELVLGSQHYGSSRTWVSLDKLVLGELGLQGRHLVGNEGLNDSVST